MYIHDYTYMYNMYIACTPNMDYRYVFVTAEHAQYVQVALVTAPLHAIHFYPITLNQECSIVHDVATYRIIAIDCSDSREQVVDSACSNDGIVPRLPGYNSGI